MQKKNQFKADSRYFTISIYTILTVLVICIIARAVFFWDSTLSVINNLLATMSPFLIGILIAFLINPLVSWMHHTVFEKWLYVKNNVLAHLLAITFSYALVIVVLVVGIIYIVPEIIDSLTQLLDKLPEWGDALISYINTIAAKHPELQLDYLIKSISNADSTIQEFLGEFISKLTTTIVVTGVSIIKFVFNFIVAIIVSIYLLIDKKMQSRGIKRTIYAIFDEERADKICAVIKRSIHIFSNFFDGKMIDSLIIGALTFVSMMIISLFGVPGFSNCALLVGIVVGITNMIPYFGPFLGGIPSILLLCIYSLNSALIFAILIIIIQQLDGNLIGPKILGNSTGLRPLWIIFAITLGGWIAGIPGMLLGVPFVAVIAGLLEDWVNERLEAKNIDMPIVKNEKVREAKEEMKEKEESK